MAVLTAFLMGAVCAGSSAPVSLVAERVSFNDLGDPLADTHVVVRVYWVGPHEADQLVGVVGSPMNELSVTVSGGTFFDPAPNYLGSRPPTTDELALDPELGYDSWLTVGNSSLDVGPAWPSGFAFEDQVILAVATWFDAGGLTVWEGGPGGGDNVAWTTPLVQEDPGGGGQQPTPQSVAGNWPDDRVLMFQLSVLPDPGVDEVTVAGELGILTVVDGHPGEVGACFSLTTYASCPADIDGNGIVDVADLIQVTLAWGKGIDGVDVNGDGIVDVSDLVEVLLAWGPC